MKKYWQTFWAKFGFKMGYKEISYNATGRTRDIPNENTEEK